MIKLWFILIRKLYIPYPPNTKHQTSIIGWEIASVIKHIVEAVGVVRVIGVSGAHVVPVCRLPSSTQSKPIKRIKCLEKLSFRGASGPGDREGDPSAKS